MKRFEKAQSGDRRQHKTKAKALLTSGGAEGVRAGLGKRELWDQSQAYDERPQCIENDDPI